jgi:hypothetical protein
MSLLRATGKVVLVIFIVYTVFNTMFVMQPQLEGAAHHRACKGRLAARPTEPSISPNSPSSKSHDCGRI